MTHGFFISEKKRLKLSPDSASGVFSMPSMMKKPASPANALDDEETCQSRDVDHCGGNNGGCRCFDRDRDEHDSHANECNDLDLVIFMESNIDMAPYSFFASHPRKMPPCSREMMVKKISANRMKTKEGIRIRVYFLPKAVPFPIALPMPKR